MMSFIDLLNEKKSIISIVLVFRDHGVYMYVVYIWKWSSAHVQGGVSGVASFINTDEQL